MNTLEGSALVVSLSPLSRSLWSETQGTTNFPLVDTWPAVVRGHRHKSFIDAAGREAGWERVCLPRKRPISHAIYTARTLATRFRLYKRLMAPGEFYGEFEPEHGERCLAGLRREGILRNDLSCANRDQRDDWCSGVNIAVNICDRFNVMIYDLMWVLILFYYWIRRFLRNYRLIIRLIYFNFR